MERFLNGLREELRSGSFRPLPVKERLIPKRGGTKTFRRLGVPALRDRVVQAALKLVLEPIFEADFQPCSYGFRPGRRCRTKDCHRASSPPNHVVQLATKALDEVRREHWKWLRELGDRDAAKAFKDARWSLLKNAADLTDRQADTLAALHAAGGKIPRAWAMKEMVRAIFTAGLSERAAAELIDQLLARLSRSRLKPFVRLGRTIRKHRDGILAARRLKLSNARAEALNNKVKLIVRRAYGFHSADAALALVHLACGPVTLTLPHEQTPA